jgi:hypothetical protein
VGELWFCGYGLNKKTPIATSPKKRQLPLHRKKANQLLIKNANCHFTEKNANCHFTEKTPTECHVTTSSSDSFSPSQHLAPMLSEVPSSELTVFAAAKKPRVKRSSRMCHTQADSRSAIGLFTAFTSTEARDMTARQRDQVLRIAFAELLEDVPETEPHTITSLNAVLDDLDRVLDMPLTLPNGEPRKHHPRHSGPFFVHLHKLILARRMQGPQIVILQGYAVAI